MNVYDPEIIANEDDLIVKRPSRAEAEEAVRTLLRWAGDDPNREGLTDTPKRVTEAYGEWFRGYSEDPVDMLQRTLARSRATMKWLSCAISATNPIASITWRQLSALRTLVTFQQIAL